jgi:hypothetical protein
MDPTDKKSLDQRFHSFWLASTPKLFEWFGWIAALGAIKFVHNKTQSLAVYLLLTCGYFVLAFYTQALFSTKISVTKIKSKHNREFVSGLLALALAYLTSVIAGHAVDAISKSAL